VNVEQTAQRTSGYAIAALVLGIAGFFVFPLIPSILAVVFGTKAKDEIRANPAVGGEGIATAGVILGWVGIAITAVGLVVVLLLVLALA
jgi:hypothetical protein